MTIMPPELAEARERMKRVPVFSVSDLFGLDPAEIQEGYGDAREGLPCGDNRSRAYWHGWRNGMMDSGTMKPDPFSALLTQDMQKRYGTLSAMVAEHDKHFAWRKNVG